MLEIAIAAAHAAGEVLVSQFGHARLLDAKKHGELVTEADLAAQEAIIAILGREFPSHHFLAEEGGRASPAPQASFWAIDPLDGTNNYAHGIPVFATSIAFCCGGKVELGVVYDPVREEIFSAQRGKGAFLNGQQLRVSQVAELEEALVGTEWTQDPSLKEPSLALIDALTRPTRALRLLGAAALSLGYLAAGRIDLYFHPGLKPWDVAAGGLLVEEAGGCITGLDGRPWDIFAQGYLAGNRTLHGQALKLMPVPSKR